MSGRSHSGVRVLIVDDSAQVRRDLRTVLALAGNAAGLPVVVVGEAGNGGKAIQLAEALRPDVVLMDLAMPGIDGYFATQAIKARDPSIRVIALTVLGYATEGTKAGLAGMDGFIEKGCPVAEIIQTIQSLLDDPQGPQKETGQKNP